MNLRHHPSHTFLVEHATGALDAGRALVVATHLRTCRACREEVALAEAVGGALLEALPGATMQPDALARALARIERPEPPPPPPPAVRARPDWIEVPTEVLHAAHRRRRWAAPGVWVAPVIRGPTRARTYLLGVAAGMSVPLHTHRGLEMVCVLKGAYTDGDVIHGPGDFAENDEGIEHRPKVTTDGECVCLIAADNPLVARDWVGRLFQPFVSI